MRKIVSLNGNAIPALLQGIPSPPKQLFVTGDLEGILARPRVAIVGSRKVSSYGRTVTQQIAGDLARQGVAIISGLALGIDSIAHKAAIDAGGVTAAVLPSSPAVVHPRTHEQLAGQMLDQGGALISEYEVADTRSFKGNFVTRNRLVSGISDAVVVVEAAMGSGSLHTARFAVQQGRLLFAVPGNITSPTSVGTNMLLQKGARVTLSAADILRALHIGTGRTKKANRPTSNNPHEQTILDLIYKGMSDGTELLHASELDARLFSQTLTMLEITGNIKPLGNNKWALAK